MVAPNSLAEPAIETSKGEGTDKKKQPSGPVMIVVKRLSHDIPGPLRLRCTAMGNQACQHVRGRDMDDATDILRSLGVPDADGKVKFLLVSGPSGEEPNVDDSYRYGFMNGMEARCKWVVAENLVILRN